MRIVSAIILLTVTAVMMSTGAMASPLPESSQDVVRVVNRFDEQRTAKSFEFLGIRLGHSVDEFLAVIRQKGWGISTYSNADGVSKVRAVDYRGVPVLDSLVDQVKLDLYNTRLGCLDAADNSRCADIGGITISFRFGQVARIEVSSPEGHEPAFRTFSLVAANVLNSSLGDADRSISDVEKFFDSYSLEKQKTWEEAVVARWSGRVEEASGDLVPYVGRIYVQRVIEKYDYYGVENAVIWPRGVCKFVVSQGTGGSEEEWSALKTRLTAERDGKKTASGTMTR